MFIKTSWVSSGLFAAILLCFFLPFMDLRCNDSLVAEANGIELITGRDIHNTSDSDPAILKNSESEDDDTSHVDRNYFAIAAFLLAVCGLVLSLLLKGNKSPRETNKAMLLAVIGLAGAMCLLLMKIQLENKMARDSGSDSKYIVTIELAYGYWITLILFLLAGAMHVFSYMQARKAEQE